MCGIAGIYRYRPDGQHLLATAKEMCDAITHRGPDDEGFYSTERVAIGMRRLAIIDVAGSRQPMSNEDGRIHLVFNGEIYNFHELRNELRARGHVFHTNGDTETIVHTYEEYGPSFVTRLNGMFVIAIWDERSNRLYLARDRFGKKPLFYAEVPGGFLFGSELKCFCVCPEFDRSIDPKALDEFLALGYIMAPRSIFRKARKLRPGHYAVIEGERILETRYWSPPRRTGETSLSPGAFAEASRELESLVEDAVRIRLESEVPLGAFLSGGLDSSVVVSMMSRLLKAPPKTFTIAFDDPELNEAIPAALTARSLGTDHREMVVRPDFQEVLPIIVWGMDEPQADPSLVPTYYVSEFARRYVTVALTGDGGDEVFAGYNRYRTYLHHRLFDRLPAVARRLAARGMTFYPPGLRGYHRLNRTTLTPIERYETGLTVFRSRQRERIYSHAWAQELDREFPQYLEPIFDQLAETDLVTSFQNVDMQTYLIDDVLAKVDRMSMINSLETRAPLLDYRIAEFAFRLPRTAFHDGQTGKLLFRDVAKRLVPPEILARPKTGFGIPTSKWLRGPLRELVHSALLDSRFSQTGWFEESAIRNLLTEHDRGVSHGTRLWALLSLALWTNQFLASTNERLAASRQSLVRQSGTP